MVLQEVDGCWNAAVAECQHRRPGHSSPTGTVERGRSDTGLSVTLVYCDQTVGWIKMPLGTELDLGPGDIALDREPSLPTEIGTAAPDITFRPMSIVAKRSLISATVQPLLVLVFVAIAIACRLSSLASAFRHILNVLCGIVLHRSKKPNSHNIKTCV